MRTFSTVLQALCFSLLVPALDAAAVPDTATASNYVSNRYMIEFREGVDAVEHTRWVRSVHRRNLAKRSQGAAGSGGVETVLRRLNGYIGDFDDLTIEEIRNHPDVSTRCNVFAVNICCANISPGCCCRAGPGL